MIKYIFLVLLGLTVSTSCGPDDLVEPTLVRVEYDTTKDEVL